MTSFYRDDIYRIESFRNAFGETRFRFLVKSILHPGTWTRTLRCWNSRAACAAAARRNGYKAK